MRLEEIQFLAQPALERRARAVDRVDRGAVEQPVLDQIDRDHFAGPEAALGDDAFGRHIPQAGFGGDDEVIVVRPCPARGAQAVAIERAGGVSRIAQDDAGRAIPGLAMQCVVFVERFKILVDVFARRPRRGNEDAHRDEHIRDRPRPSGTSSILSRLCELEPDRLTSGPRSDNSTSSRFIHFPRAPWPNCDCP